MDKTKVFDFIDGIEKTRDEIKRDEQYRSSQRFINDSVAKVAPGKKEACLRDMICDVYKDAVPMTDLAKSRCEDELKNGMDDFITQNCPQGVLMYVTDAKRPNAFTETAKKVCAIIDRNYLEAKEELTAKQKEVGPLQKSDVDQALAKADEKTDLSIAEIASKAGHDDLASAIKEATSNRITEEVTAAKAIKKETKDYVDSLKNDPSINSREALESAIALHSTKKQHDPTLFESILLSKIGPSGIYESVADLQKEEVLLEAAKEYTKHAVWKAFRMRRYDIPAVKEICRSYLAG